MITELQRQQRRHYLGSSDSPIIMGLSPYKKTGTDIFWSKVAKVQDESTESMNVGNWIEAPLLQWAAEELGVTITTKPKDLFQVAQEGVGAGLLCANHDSLIVGKDESIEAKFANGEMAQEYGEPGTDQVAYHVIIQVQHQMYCSNLSKVYVALAVPSYYGVDRRLYCVPRDEELIRMIVEFGREWWMKHVAAQPEPLPPNGESTPPLYVLKALERKAGAQIRLDERAIPLVNSFEEMKAQAKELDGNIETMKAKLIDLLGDGEIGLLPDGRRLEFKGSQRSYFDQPRFMLENPALAAEYSEQRVTRSFYVKQPKSKK